MKGLLFCLEKFIEYQTAFDNPISKDYIKREYLNILTLTGFYADIKETDGKVLAVTSITVQLLLLCFYTSVQSITAIKSLGWSTPFTLMALNNSLLFVLAILLVLRPLMTRREFSVMHYYISTNFYEYSLETKSDAYVKFKNIYSKVRRYYLIFPLFGLVVLQLLILYVRPETDGKDYVNGMYTKLCFVIWLPFECDNWPLYLLMNITQVIHALIVLESVTMSIYIMLVCTLHWLMQIHRLVDSIESTEERAFYMYRELKSNRLINDYLPEEIEEPYELYSNSLYVECYIRCIKENIAHHQILLRYLKDFGTASDYQLVASLVLCAIVLSLSVYTISLGEMKAASIYAAYIGSILLAISFYVCYFGQAVTESNAKVREAFYSLRWYQSHKRVTEMVKMILIVTVKPRTPTAFGFIPYNYETFSTLIQYSYSCFQLVRLRNEL